MYDVQASQLKESLSSLKAVQEQLVAKATVLEQKEQVSPEGQPWQSS